tara:strand:+ start:55 stop:558 length:504 start_codon:yes stop_codon:yes gene_type:complete
LTDQLCSRLSEYKNDAAIYCRAHHISADRAELGQTVLGVCAAVSSATVGLTLILERNLLPEFDVGSYIGIVSIMIAGVTGFLTYYNFSDKSIKHRIAAQNYNSERRKIADYMAILSSKNADDVYIFIEAISERMCELQKNSPSFSNGVFSAAKVSVQKYNVADFDTE